MKQRAREQPSTEHERVYHAAPQCQAAALSLTPRRLHDRQKACSVEGKKTGGFASQAWTELGDAGRMPLFCRNKSRWVIGGAGEPHGIQNPQPQVGESTYGDRMTFAFSPFAVIVLQCPRLTPGRLPGEQVEDIAQRFQTSGAPVCFLIIATLIQDGSRASQSLQASTSLIALPVVPQFCQQPRSQAFPCPGQAFNEAAVSMRQKKGLNVLIVAGDLLDKRHQLTDQDQHQTGFRARGNGISCQLWLMQDLVELWGDLLGCWMASLLEHLHDLLLGGRLCGFLGGKGLQKGQGRALVQLAEEFQGDWIVSFETSRELGQGAGLHLNQRMHPGRG
jgi:hypothetical protein